jgi:hypothetical protein
METVLNNNMLNLLNTIKNSMLTNIECEFEEKWKRAYGYVRLNTTDKSIDITNVQKPIELFGEVDDVAVFECHNNTGKTLKEAFDLIDTFSPTKKEVNEIVENIDIIEEEVIINNSKMIFDMGIIIKTKSHTYIISRENWFNEFIYVNVDKTFDEIYPIEKDIEIWNINKNDKISINRYIKSIE